MSTTSTPAKAAPKSFLSNLTDQAPEVLAPAVEAEPADEPSVKFGSLLTPSNDLALHRLSYWTPGTAGSIQTILNVALAEYFARQPESQRPTPEENKPRRGRGRH